MEREILSACMYDRNAYDYLETVIDTETDLSAQGKIIHSAIARFYELDQTSKSVDKKIAKARITRDYPKHYEGLCNIVDSMDDVVSTVNLAHEVCELKMHNIRQELASMLLANNPEAESLMERLQQLKENGLESKDDSDQDDSVICDLDIEDLPDDFDKNNLIKMYPPILNEKIGGGLTRKNHVLIYARPEVGKSLLSINAMCGFAVNGYKILYIGNEDPIFRIYYRCVARLSGIEYEDVINDKATAIAAARKAGFANIMFKELAPGSAKRISYLVAKYKPDVLVVDQLRNLVGGGDGLVGALEYNGRAMRNIAKKYDVLVLSVTQAGATADNKLVLGQSDVDNSKTGLPAAIDLMIGVGMNDAFESTNQRMISLCKNKINGCHEYFPVSIEPKISKVDNI